MNRRKFLQIAGLAGSGVVASATMAEAGLFAEIMSWLKRRPVWSIPKNVTATVSQYSDYASFTDLSLETAISPTVEKVADELAYRAAITMNTIAADDLLPELASTIPLRQLATIYYDKKALDNLKANVLRWEATSDARAQWASERMIDHSDEERLCYTKNDKSETRRVVYNQDTHKIDLLPTSSLAFKT